MRLLFLCGMNLVRSPTAEAIFAQVAETQSAGLNPQADTVVTLEQIQWAEIIFVMEEGQRNKLNRMFRRHLGDKKVVCLDISDDCAYMDAGLVRKLLERVPRSVPGLQADPRWESRSRT